MRAKSLLWWVGGAVAAAALIDLDFSPAMQQPTQQTAGGYPKAQTTAAKKRKPALIPLQRDIQRALASNNAFLKPKQLAYQDSYELRLGKKTFTNANASQQGGTPQQFELLCYNDQPVGPIIRVLRGTTFRIRVVNDLDCGDDPDNTPMLPPNAIFRNEKPYGLCTTNLHTHGLHVSPSGNSDNIFQAIGPKKGPKNGPPSKFEFEYTIGPDHPSGTFWYHPHKHGSVAYQLANGLAGALIVEGDPKKDRSQDLDGIPEISAAVEQVLVLQLYNYNVDPTDNIARIDAQSLYNILPDSQSCAAISIKTPPPSPPLQATAINGVIVPTITLAPGEVQRWRIIDATWDALKPLTWFNYKDEKTEDIQFREIALDGLTTGVMAVKSRLDLAPGQRSDVLIKAPVIPEGQTAVYFLKQDAVPAAQAPHGVEGDVAILARVVITGKANPMPLPDPNSLARCRPFKSIRDEELSWPAAVGAGLVFAADDGDPKDPLKTAYYTINGKTFHDQQPLQMKLGSAEEWTITAGVSNHPFHLHVNPFQIVKYSDPTGKSRPMNVWRDTLYILEGETYTIRTRFLDYPGKSVLHCHILDHEDQGMMMPIEILDPSQPQKPADKKGKLGSRLQSVAIPAPAFKLPDTGGALLGLAKFRGRTLLLVFFQGVECSHCAAQLRDLLFSARGAIGSDTEIVAVSSRTITEPDKALMALGVAQLDKFHLLTDSGQVAFRDFGCYDDGPMHGLFLIDRDGVIRAGYRGLSPFDDNKEVVRRANALALAGAKPGSR